MQAKNITFCIESRVCTLLKLVMRVGKFYSVVFTDVLYQHIPFYEYINPHMMLCHLIVFVQLPGLPLPSRPPQGVRSNHAVLAHPSCQNGLHYHHGGKTPHLLSTFLSEFIKKRDSTPHHVITPASAACGLRGEVLRGLDDPGRAVGREGAVQTRALPDPRVPAQLRGEEYQNPAERQFHPGAAVRYVLAIGHARGVV